MGEKSIVSPETLNVIELLEHMIKTISALLYEFKDYRNPYDHIRLLVKDGSLIKLKRGLYETSIDENPFVIASVLYAPSYVSFQSALSFYGLIPERAVAVTSASLGARKNKNYRNSFGSFSYQDVPEKAYSLGLKWMENFGSPYFIATKEKALCDLLAKIEPIPKENFEAFLYDDLRIDKEIFLTFNKPLVLSIAKTYQTKNVFTLLNYIMKEN